jgi:hypothetical protein
MREQNTGVPPLLYRCLVATNNSKMSINVLMMSKEALDISARA